MARFFNSVYYLRDIGCAALAADAKAVWLIPRLSSAMLSRSPTVIIPPPFSSYYNLAIAVCQ